MKKTVHFICWMLLLVAVFTVGVLAGKAQERKKETDELLLQLLRADTASQALAEQATFSESILFCTVSIQITFKGEKDSITKSGTGIIYALDKERGNATVLSCEHLFCEDGYALSDISVYLYKNEVPSAVMKGTYKGGSRTFDCALLSIENSDILKHSFAQCVKLKETYTLGQSVYAAGNANGRGISVTKGIVSATADTNTSQSGWLSHPFIRTDAPLNFGCSGGGLFEENGAFLGMICARQSSEGTVGIGYALPSAFCRAIADSILAYGEVRMPIPPFTCMSIGYRCVWENKATVSEKLTVAQTKHNRIFCGDVILYTKAGESATLISSYAELSQFLLCTKEECVTLGLYRHGEIIEVPLDTASTLTAVP